MDRARGCGVCRDAAPRTLNSSSSNYDVPKGEAGLGLAPKSACQLFALPRDCRNSSSAPCRHKPTWPSVPKQMLRDEVAGRFARRTRTKCEERGLGCRSHRRVGILFYTDSWAGATLISGTTCCKGIKLYAEEENR